MSKLGNQSNAFFRSPQVWAAFRQVLQRQLPLHLQHTRLSSEEVLAVLSYASLRQSTLETACHELPCAPSGNRLREVLMAALPTRSVLQRQLNTALRAQLPKVFFQNKRSYALALDVTLIPYHGQPAATPRRCCGRKPSTAPIIFMAMPPSPLCITGSGLSWRCVCCSPMSAWWTSCGTC